MNISDEAIEAAAKALRKKFNGYEVERAWDSRDQRTTYRNDAIAALEAAAPHMLATVWDEGYEVGDMPCETAVPCGDCAACNAPAPSNPYRPQP